MAVSELGKKFKQCAHCGHITLSEHEKKVLEQMPGTVSELSARTGLKPPSVRQNLNKLMQYGAAYTEKSNGGYIYRPRKMKINPYITDQTHETLVRILVALKDKNKGEIHKNLIINDVDHNSAPSQIIDAIEILVS